MAYHSFLVEPISCHAWNKDRTGECLPSPGAFKQPSALDFGLCEGQLSPLLHFWSRVFRMAGTSRLGTSRGSQASGHGEVEARARPGTGRTVDSEPPRLGVRTKDITCNGR